MHNNLSSKNLPLKPWGEKSGKGFNHVIWPHFSGSCRYFVEPLRFFWGGGVCPIFVNEMKHLK